MNLKIVAVALLLFSVPAFGQAKTKAEKPPVADAKPAPPTPPKAPPADVVTPKESIATLKLALALEKEKSLQEQAQSLQQQAQQAIEPRLQPLRAEYQAQSKTAKEQEDAVRKENGYGPDIVLDSTLGSPTFGQWVKKKSEEKK